ncbi:adenine deaminase [Hafnia alvei]|jgi:adenine deaminase|uniref:adenine deaminase n=1 Tax=Hafnia alvei TaxID=569 RepID=UPI0006215E60|nr:adenine deaminase [Hafnia alvei]KKI45682.1 adenine deaminase [Hafnia alvei]MEB7891319.1 adenine deaminase [Hafnia alvei]QIP58022.1 adenine deaminase [Hafnia alvei]TBL88619.1 adenine deaminase [Hafnia alvei]
MEGINNKHTQSLSREEMIRLLAVSRGDEAADCIIDNVRILDLINGGELLGPIVICGANIAGIGPAYAGAVAHRRIDANNAIAVPGFIDSHLHIESSMMTPITFESATLPLGVTSIVCDPHEIVNVMGKQGLEWFLRCAEQAQQNQFVQISSCVPALAGSDINGAEFPLDEMLKYRDHSHVLGLAEMMNFPGVIAGDSDIMDKLDAFRHLTLDGHSPMLSGKDLNGYLAAGVENCHETLMLQEGREKLSLGMALMMREGSAARNLDTLAPLITEFSSPQCMLCTDDRNPWEIAHEGHINALIHRLINQHNIPAHVAYRVASWSPARHFGLKRLGLIAPGKRADIVLLNDVQQVEIQQVIAGGKRVDAQQLTATSEQRYQQTQPPTQNTIQRTPVDESALTLPLDIGERYRAIQVIPNELITCELPVIWQGERFDHDDVCKIAVMERYGHQKPPALGLLQNFGLKRGAMAATVSHDSHNIVVIGHHARDMAIAVNQLISQGGGLCVADEGEVKSHLSLPIAGLMSDKPAAEIADDITHLKNACRRCGVTLNEPFIQMAFLSLPVIPSLKLTSLGLFDVDRFAFTETRFSVLSD